MSLAENKCNATALDFVPQATYYEKLQLIQGSLLLSALVPIFIGCTGLVGESLSL